MRPLPIWPLSKERCGKRPFPLPALALVQTPSSRKAALRETLRSRRPTSAAQPISSALISPLRPSFRRIVFAGPARFVGAHFRTSAFFVDSRFKQEATFAGATFAQPFRPNAHFSGAPDVADVTRSSH